jgi:hypothetical protein
LLIPPSRFTIFNYRTKCGQGFIRRSSFIGPVLCFIERNSYLGFHAANVPEGTEMMVTYLMELKLICGRLLHLHVSAKVV